MSAVIEAVGPFDARAVEKMHAEFRKYVGRDDVRFVVREYLGPRHNENGELVNFFGGVIFQWLFKDEGAGREWGTFEELPTEDMVDMKVPEREGKAMLISGSLGCLAKATLVHAGV